MGQVVVSSWGNRQGGRALTLEPTGCPTSSPRFELPDPATLRPTDEQRLRGQEKAGGQLLRENPTELLKLLLNKMTHPSLRL